MGRNFQKTVDHQEYSHIRNVCTYTDTNNMPLPVFVGFALTFKKMSGFSDTCQKTFLIPFAKRIHFSCDQVLESTGYFVIVRTDPYRGGSL